MPGPVGPAGASGAVQTLHAAGVWSPATLLGNNGNAIFRPEVCTTASHTAGKNEAAVVHTAGTATPSNPANDVLYINVMRSVEFATFTIMTTIDQAESMSDGTAQTSTMVYLPLEEGKAYRFASGFSSNSNVAIGTGYCSIIASIVKTQ